MSNPAATETFGQARQGSVAAIIQVLNERLADSGIRTRAVVADGMLQLLCEAQSTEQLEKQAVVSHVRQILENISPQRIRRVNINSRLVKEEQLLWLEEINRDPENALLWSEIITLKQPFFFQRWIRDRDLKPAGPIFKDITEPTRTPISLSNKLIGGAGIAVLVLATGWLFREDLSQIRQVNDTNTEDIITQPQTALPPLPNTTTSNTTSEELGQRAADTTPPDNPQASTTPQATTQAQANQAQTDQTQTDQTQTSQAQTPGTSDSEPSNSTDQSPEPSTSNTPNDGATPAIAQPSEAAPTPPPDTGRTADAFAEAVRIANSAATDGQTAATAAQWLDLAARWQRASDLMAQIPEGNPQYEQAKERVTSYADNSKAALSQAAALQ